MARLTQREKQILGRALTIACEDGSIYSTGDNEEEDEKLRAEMQAEIDEIFYKLSASWNRTP